MLLIPITVGLAWVALEFAGGVSGLMDEIKAQDLANEFALISSNNPAETASLAWLAAILLQNSIAYNTLNASVRYFSVKDGREARKAAALGALLFLVGPVFWIIPPMVGRLFFSAQIEASAMPVPAEASYAIVSLNLLPTGVLGLMIIAIFAATMSSMDTGINRAAAIAIKDIYPALCRLFGWREGSPKAQLLGSKLVALFFGGLILWLALYFASQETKGLFDIMIDLMSLVSLPLSIPLLIALFVKRSPVWAGWFSAAVGALPASWAFFSPQFGAEPWSLAMRVFTIFATGSLAFIVSTAFWRFSTEDYRLRVNEFFTTMRRPVDFEKEVGEASDGMQLKLIGGSLAAMGLLIGFLLLAQDSELGRYFIVGVSLFLIVVGGSMAWAGGRARL
jgi:Na+/proline symporter